MPKKNRKSRKYTKPLKANNTKDNSQIIISKFLDVFPDKIKDKEYLTKEFNNFFKIYKGTNADTKDTDLVLCMFCKHLLHNGDERIRTILLGE